MGQIKNITYKIWSLKLWNTDTCRWRYTEILKGWSSEWNRENFRLTGREIQDG